MSEPGEIQFVCIGCGAMNPAGAEACAGCGHRFAGPDVLASPGPIAPNDRPRPLPRPAPPLNPYEPPSSPIAPPTTFRIGTGLVIIAVIAVCLGALRADLTLGIVTILFLGPAAIRTPLVVESRRRERRPMGIDEQIGTFLMTMVATFGVMVSSLIAFFMTCLPSGLVTSNIGVGLVVGAAGGIACAVWLTRVFLRMSRENAARDREIRYR